MTFSFNGETVRKHDPDRFLLSLFVPADRREALWTLYAFNHEIAKTREVVTETQLGLIRLQWWRDEIGRIYDGKQPSPHQVLTPLAEAAGVHALPRELFDSLIYAREFDLEDRQPASLEGLLNYADFTSTPLMTLSLLIAAPQEREGESAVRNIAIAYALTGLLRAAPAHFAQRRCYFPEDRTPPKQKLFEGKELEKLKLVVKEIAEAAGARLADARLRGRFLRRHAKLASLYLRQIEKTGYDVFSPKLRLPPLLREIRLFLV